MLTKERLWPYWWLTVAGLALVLLLLLLGGKAQGANNWTGDADVMAAYNFENGALTVDSSDRTETLTAFGNPAVANTTDYKQGAASTNIESALTDYYARDYAVIHADWPLVSDGAIPLEISVVAWLKFESFANTGFYRPWYEQHQGSSAYTTITMAAYSTNGTPFIRAETGYDRYLFGANFTVDVWYHVCMTYDASTQQYKIHIWDDDAGDYLGETVTGTMDNTPTYYATGNVYVGGHGNTTRQFDGLMDELVVFKKILSTAECNAIRGGTYPETAAGGQVIGPIEVNAEDVIKKLHRQQFYEVMDSWLDVDPTLAFAG